MAGTGRFDDDNLNEVLFYGKINTLLDPMTVLSKVFQPILQFSARRVKPKPGRSYPIFDTDNKKIVT